MGNDALLQLAELRALASMRFHRRPRDFSWREQLPPIYFNKTEMENSEKQNRIPSLKPQTEHKKSLEKTNDL